MFIVGRCGGFLTAYHSGVKVTVKRFISNMGLATKVETNHLGVNMVKNNAQLPTSAHVKDVYDSILQSEEDKRSYRGVQLTNGVKIILISDPTCDKAAASLDVNVGSLQDPKELPGLAHFCEHMLFLGTTKYPTENEYQKTISNCGGTYNAYTNTDHTSYFFDVAPDRLMSILDQFAQFFISPLFTATATEREVNAVDSENLNNLQNDTWRLNQLEHSLADPNHDYSKFGTGNKETLLVQAKEKGLDTREELLKFHQNHYSGNLMSVVVLGKESIEELTDKVIPMFVPVENKNLSVPRWDEHPYGEKQLRKRIHAVPIKDIRSLHVGFPVPDMDEHRKSNPQHYLGHLIGHEGPGSLLSELKRRGWINTLVGGNSPRAKGFAFFTIDVDLTEEGVTHVDEIILLMFQYLNMLRRAGPQEWIHRECADLSHMHFRFKDKESARSYVMGLSRSMHHFPMEEVLFGPYMMPEYKPELIDWLLEMLVPDKMNVVVTAKAFEGKTSKKEFWYGTDYELLDLDTQLLEKCRNPGYNENLKLPKPNEFIPKNFSLYPLEPVGESVKIGADEKSFPEVILNDRMMRIWFKQDDEFFLPKSCICVQLTSPIPYTEPMAVNLTHMFVSLLHDSLTEYTYDASLSGLNYSIDNGKYGLTLSLHGYNEKLHVLLEKLVERMIDLTIDPKRFELLKEAYVRQLKNFSTDQPYQHAIYYTSMMLNERSWSKQELIEESERMTVETLAAYIPRFFASLHFEGLVAGNVTKADAIKMVCSVKEIIERKYSIKPLFPGQFLKDREVKIPEGSYFIYEAQHKFHASHGVEVYLQTGMQDTADNMLLELLSQIISEPCFDQIRTKEQLGYVVFSGLRRANGSQGLRFLVQSQKTPSYVEMRLEMFIQDMLEQIKKLSDEEFEEHKTALASKRSERPKRLGNLVMKYWGEIQSGQFHFDRDYNEVAYLRSITREQMVEFYKDLISFDSPKRRKLAIYVVSDAALKEAGKGGDEVPTLEGSVPLPPPTKIEDFVSFKTKLPLCPYPRAFLDVPNPVLQYANLTRSML